jgi:hypothetical protein
VTRVVRAVWTVWAVWQMQHGRSWSGCPAVDY